MSELYGPDLAYAHAEGYGFHWQQAAPFLLGQLGKNDPQVRRVLDVGCGGGQWLRVLADAGYRTVGLDVSPAMVKLAKKNSPRSKFLTGSVHQMTLPEVDAVTAIGEPLNYLKDNTAIEKALDRIADAVVPGGLFAFDVRLPQDPPPADRQHGNAAKDFAVIANIAYKKGGREIVRDITTFKQVGKHWRRTDEQHVLTLPAAETWITWLRRRRFEVEARPAYGRYALPDDCLVFIARRSTDHPTT